MARQEPGCATDAPAKPTDVDGLPYDCARPGATLRPVAGVIADERWLNGCDMIVCRFTEDVTRVRQTGRENEPGLHTECP